MLNLLSNLHHLKSKINFPLTHINSAKYYSSKKLTEMSSEAYSYVGTKLKELGTTVTFPHIAYAIKSNNLDLFNSLKDYRPTYENEICPFSGDNIIHIAAKAGNVDIIESHLKDNDSRVNQLNHKGETPLISLIKEINSYDNFIYDSHLGIINHLIQKGAWTSYSWTDSSESKTIHATTELLKNGEIELFKSFILVGAEREKEVELNNQCLKFKYSLDILQLSDLLIDIKDKGLLEAIKGTPEARILDIMQNIKFHQSYVSAYLEKYGQMFDFHSLRANLGALHDQQTINDAKYCLAVSLINSLQARHSDDLKEIDQPLVDFP
ncbi:MAG: hypothetical protein K0Q51_1314, partial [Rickettsiaceae bacterium]|nr:hypothetical protein [Rickettsiaceae bacterium]